MTETKDFIYNAVHSELNAAEQALRIGNVGKARVCARRAGGIAISHWLKLNPNKIWGESALNQLNELKVDESFPVELREAAKRLTTRVDQHFDTGFENNPIDDGNIIVEYFQHHKNLETNER